MNKVFLVRERDIPQELCEALEWWSNKEISAETHGLESTCGSTNGLESCIRLHVGLPIFRRSYRSRRMDRGSELLVYQLERIDGSLAVPVLKKN